MAISNAQAYNLSNKLGRRAAKDADLGTALQTAQTDLDTAEAKLNATQAVHVVQSQRIRVDYDDLSDGVPLDVGTALPDNAIITRVYYEVLTTWAGDGDDSSTINIGSPEAVDDLVAATAISAGGNVWDAGFHEGIQDGTAANYVKLTAAGSIQVELNIVSTDTAVTAGSMDIFVEWVQGA